jgi:hypothetical protein
MSFSQASSRLDELVELVGPVEPVGRGSRGSKEGQTMAATVVALPLVEQIRNRNVPGESPKAPEFIDNEWHLSTGTNPGHALG